MKIEITPKAVLARFLRLIIFLLFANLVSIFLKSYFYYDDVHGLTRLFNFSAEKNIPTFFSSFTLAFCAILLLVITVTHKRLGSSFLAWSGLAVIFLFLSIDEAVSLHEKLTMPIRELLNTSGFLYFAWVIPYSAALVVFLVLYFRFLTNLPRKIMSLFIISGAIYVSGAIGLEMIGGLQSSLHGGTDLIYLLIVTFEELLEMVGIAIFIYALLLYIAEHFEMLTITMGMGLSEKRTRPLSADKAPIISGLK